MGIRFYCPQGHKLNVKEFQAGRMGICPYCGAKMQIPLESTRPSSRQGKSQSAEAEYEIAEQKESDGDSDGNPILPPPPPAGLSADSPDPLAEAGNVVWYVRPTSGGQFGPAPADVMRTWLAEGRVAAETLVWREGWRDWREAGGVFPQLAPASEYPGLENVIEEPAKPARRDWNEKRRADDFNTKLFFAGGLALAVILLLVILIMVLGNS